MIPFTELAAALLPFALLGALGSAHCLGMCGGIAVAVSTAGGASRGRLLRRMAPYALGKATTYALLAVLLATWIGPDPEARAAVDPGIGRALAVGTGLCLVLIGLFQLGLGRFVPDRFAAVIGAPIGRALALVRTVPGAAGSFGVGVVNGLLPCGLSWGAVLLASQHAPPVAAGCALVFGLSTGPALVGLGLGAGRLGRSKLVLAQRLVALSLIVYGGLTAARGGLPGSAATHACCGAAAEASDPPVRVDPGSH